MNINISEKILPNFYELWKASKDDAFLHIVAKGGRNSSKSTTLSIIIVYRRMRYKSHALVLRKVDKTLRKSCREQLIWAIEHLGVSQYWSYGTTPSCDMTLTYKPTGTKIFFEGCNNSSKIKSWKTSDYPTSDLWFEELDEFHQEDDISTILNSFLRAELEGNLKNKFFYSYNPPKRKQSWLNKKYESSITPPATYIHHSDYRHNPYVSNLFKIEADHVANHQPQRYKWEYLGHAIGGGVVPFENLTFREITNDEIASFDNIRMGIDWGYASDPFAFVKCHYDKTRRKVYIIDEIYKVKLSNREAVKLIKEKNVDNMLIMADSAEPKSIAECREYGLYIEGVKKGAGSVEFGEKWLDDLEEIVIDPNRTPNAAKEFENIDYQVDKDGNIRNKLVDKDNHLVDGLRYSLSLDMIQSDSIIFI